MRNRLLFLIGASLLGAGLGIGLGPAVNNAYAEGQNVKVSGDLTAGLTGSQPSSSSIKKTLRANREMEKYFEGKMFRYEDNLYSVQSPSVREDKIVFYTNFYSDAEDIQVEGGKKIPLNFELFIADISDKRLTNIKRLTKTRMKYETYPLWTEEDKPGGSNIAYIEFEEVSIEKGGLNFNGENSCYKVIDTQGDSLKDMSPVEYISLKKKYESLKEDVTTPSESDLKMTINYVP